MASTTQRMRIYGPSNETFVTCDCGCGTSAPASSFYHKISSCPNGGCTQAFLEKFVLKPIENPKALKTSTKKKSSESASKATTPTKDSSQDGEEIQEPVKKVTKKQKIDDSSAKTTKDDDMGKDGRPKKPLTAYMLFTADKRDGLRQENPSASMGDISKLIGAQWKELSEDDKKPWTEKAAQLKAEYEEKYGMSESAKKQAAKADKPKGARSSYMIWLADNREKLKEEFPALNMKELMSKAGEKWRELSEEDKATYKEKAEKEKAEVEAAKEGKEIESPGTKRQAEEEGEEEVKAVEKKDEKSEAEDEKEADAEGREEGEAKGDEAPEETTSGGEEEPEKPAEAKAEEVDAGVQEGGESEAMEAEGADETKGEGEESEDKDKMEVEEQAAEEAEGAAE